MGSFHSPNLWSPSSVYRDCSQGICSIYCPQWCYIIYPPPPPSVALGDDPDDDSSGFEFSPLIVAVIGILACAFILATYYTIISRFCRRRGQISDQTSQLDENGDPLNTQLAQVSSSSGLDEALIKSIPVCKYKKGDGLVEGADCSVCLSEFQENESLRLLPKCNHAFHPQCIDTWLKSHSSCPLCRSNLSSSTISLPNLREAQIQEAPPTSMRVSAMEYQHRNDTIIVIQRLEHSLAQEIVVSFGAEDAENLEERNGLQLNSCTSQCRVSVNDILNASEEDEESQREELEVGSSRGIEGGEEREENGKSTGVVNMVRSPMGIKRSASTGRFVITRPGKGKNYMVSN